MTGHCIFIFCKDSKMLFNMTLRDKLKRETSFLNFNLPFYENILELLRVVNFLIKIEDFLSTAFQKVNIKVKPEVM